MIQLDKIQCQLRIDPTEKLINCQFYIMTPQFTLKPRKARNSVLQSLRQ
jgi:hypothetical protein